MNTLQTIRPELLVFRPEQMHAMLPLLVALAGIALGMIAAVFKWMAPRWSVPALVIASLVIASVIAVDRVSEAPMLMFNGMMISDAFSQFFTALFFICAAVSAFVSFRYLDREQLQYPEYYLMMLFSAIGMAWMASATELVTMFICLELMSLSIYVLVGFRRADRRSNEAAMKYFTLGSVASAVLLYGMALVYGATGSLQIQEILGWIRQHPESMDGIFLVGSWLVVVGFLFKVASVPFHAWMPDVYEGAPTPITGFMTTGIKAASFAAFIRVYFAMGYAKGLPEMLQTHVHHIVWFCAVATMLIGNVVALTQVNLKRMLAYSSIAHTGYLLVGLLASGRTEESFAPMVLYLLSYCVMNLGTFIILTLLAKKADSGLNLHDLSGVAKRYPLLSFTLAVFLFSMAGIPPTAGFVAKYMIFYSAVQAGEIWLTVIGVLCSAISVYYYLRVLVYLYMREPSPEASPRKLELWPSLVAVGLAALTLQVGLAPMGALNVAKKAVQSLFAS